jgi:hypothetical protein
VCAEESRSSYEGLNTEGTITKLSTECLTSTNLGRRDKALRFVGSSNFLERITELVSHFLFADRFGRPGKGNDKGKVEGMVKFMRLNYLTPIPHALCIDALNVRLLERCLARQRERAGRHEQTIGERLAADKPAFRELPAMTFEPCHKFASRVSSQALAHWVLISTES